MTASYPRPYGSYLLLEPLGAGGMSAVDLAQRTVDDASYVRFLVIKRIHGHLSGQPGFVKMFQDEARINAELQHENIAQVYDFGRVDQEWYLAMEYVPGTDLYRLVKTLRDRERRLPPRIALRVLCDVLSALHYAHTRMDTYGQPMNVVHRDVGPRNIMISLRGEVKLIDFGVAKADNRENETEVHTIKGKFAYMAPEQIDESLPVDGRADLFALGILLYEIVNGKHPFAGLGRVQVMGRVLAAKLPELEDHDEYPGFSRLRAVAERATSRHQDERFQSAEEFRAALERVAEPLGGLARRADIATFLRDTDPGAVTNITKRLEAYRSQRDPGIDLTPLQTEEASRETRALLLDKEATDDITTRVSNPGSRSESLPGAASQPSSTLAPTPPVVPPIHAQTLVPPSVPGPPSRDAPSKTAVRGAVGALIALLVLGIGIAGAVFWLAQPADRAGASPATPNEAAPSPVETTVTTPEPDEPLPPETEGSNPTAPPPLGAAAAPPASPRPTTAPAPQRKPPTRPAPKPAPKQDPEPVAAPVPAPAPAAQPTAEAAPETAAAEQGFLFATSRPTSGHEVLVDGSVVGTTPLRSHALSVGSHTVVIRDPQSGRQTLHSVEIRRGQPTVIRSDGP